MLWRMGMPRPPPVPATSDGFRNIRCNANLVAESSNDKPLSANCVH